MFRNDIIIGNIKCMCDENPNSWIEPTMHFRCAPHPHMLKKCTLARCFVLLQIALDCVGLSTGRNSPNSYWNSSYSIEFPMNWTSFYWIFIGLYLVVLNFSRVLYNFYWGQSQFIEFFFTFTTFHWSLIRFHLNALNFHSILSHLVNIYAARGALSRFFQSILGLISF